MQKKFTAFLLLLALLLPVFAAQAQTDAQNAGERLQIVASYSILADVVRNVAGDAADVVSLIPIGGDPHTFTPSPRDIATVADADVIFINGANFEETLLDAIENAGAAPNIVIASQCVAILPTSSHAHDHESHDHEHEEHDHEEDAHDHDHETVLAEFDSKLAEQCAKHQEEMAILHGHGHSHDHDHEGHDHEEDAHDHDHEGHDHEEDAHDHDHEGHDHEEDAHDHDHEGHDHDHSSRTAPLGLLYTLDCGAGEGHDHDHEEDGHDHGACDSHVWMDPHNVIYWSFIIRDALIELDPANAEIYTANAAAYVAELDALAHDELGPQLHAVPEDKRILVTNHETLGYLANAAGYRVVGTVIPGGNSAADPSAAEIAALIDTIREYGVVAVFAENTVNTKLAEQVAAESGAQFYVLLSDSLSDADGEGATYLDYMRYNARVIVEALSAE